MEKKKTNVVGLIALIAVLVVIVIGMLTTNADSVQKSFWSLVPPIIAISLALITKEVYSSLFTGIVVGGLLYTGYSFEGTINHIFQAMVGYTDENEAFVNGVLTDSWNMGILIFLVILGVMVALMNKAGGSAAFGKWASEHIKSKVGAQLATIALGVLIFVDDYFNCLTVGSVMRPVTDKFQVSRAKLAYLIDATAAPVCIIAPISSWAAAVSSFVKEGENGIVLFMRAIPYNFYALLTVAMMILLVVMKVDYGPMAVHEKNAEHGDLFTTKDEGMMFDAHDDVHTKGTVLDLVIPVATLIICCVIGMVWTGGIFSGTGFVDAFANSDASTGLAVGSFFAFLITLVVYMVRRVLTFEEFMGCVPQGFKAMVPAILILTFAWTLKSMTDSLGAAEYVKVLVKDNAASFMAFLPAVIFLIAVGLAFATGTSWGTFGILIPIVQEAFSKDPQLMLIAMSACMAGAVCGDHCSPISDTTIMASAGAMCNHVNHVSTQLPYALTVAGVSAVAYIVAGFTKSWLISLPVGFVLLLALMMILKNKGGKTPAPKADAAE